MRITYFAAILLGTAIAANAQGYKDGIEYYKAGQFDNAITILNRNLTSADTDKALANYYLGQAYLNKGDKAKAKTYFDAGIVANPDCGYNYVGLGAIDLLNNARSSAELNFKKATGLAKKNTEILVDIARAYYNADATAYEKEIDKYIANARKVSKNQEPAIYIFEGDRKTAEKDYNGAATEYEQAIYFDQDNPEGYVKYANTYFNVVPDYAVQKLEELLAKQPNSALAQRELAEKYFDNGKLTRAAQQYGKYINNPNHFPQDKARYAVLLFAGSNFDDALDVAREVLKETPDELSLNRIVYRSLNEVNKKDEALQEATKFFNNPAFNGKQNSGDYRIYAQLLAGAGQDSLAVEVLQNGIAALPEDAPLALELSNVLDAQKKATQGADAYAAYMALIKEPTFKDYNTGSQRFLNAVLENKDNEELRMKYATTGIEMVDKAINPEKPSPTFLLRKIQLQLNRDGGIMGDEAAATSRQLIEVLDSDADYANPDYKGNYLAVYRILWGQLRNYYDRAGNQEAADNAKAMLEKYEGIINAAKQ